MEHARLEAAQRLCALKGLQFTALRRQVYALVCEQDTPIGAYELLDRLKHERKNAAPATVYRTLDFLLEAGLIHRIEALNAFTACDAQEHGHTGLLLVCNACKQVTELQSPELERRIAQTARAFRFDTGSELIEIRGLCDACRDSGGSGTDDPG